MKFLTRTAAALLAATMALPTSVSAAAPSDSWSDMSPEEALAQEQALLDFYRRDLPTRPCSSIADVVQPNSSPYAPGSITREEFRALGNAGFAAQMTTPAARKFTAAQKQRARGIFDATMALWDNKLTECGGSRTP
ncbi:hypothetical protein C1Y63_10095 [Corynebacterium sp. 13CS0277]|uniref:hypothetical protein n=1 Tax=Corynebacterium sp. 13CS0277 TaxID=2071994 RepID=UPI000D0244F1|nr:hypothetical protein [Corynebacterium sp. 13CS0277]PRQ10718.1 hypothetical protein C1Y63_10095 [Corynebacterium sp. 13CS0277]